MLNQDTFQPQNFLILVVDDASKNVKLIGQMLTNEGYSITFATSGKQAIERVEMAGPDLILLDFMMPEINGLQVCKLLQADPVYSNIPIIFLTASDNKKHIREAFQVGAVDYISKPFNAPELLARVKTHLELKQAREEAVEAGRIKTEFLANLSHEIRTPMNAVLGMTELLLTTQLNNQQRDFVATIKSSGKNLLTLINDLLDFSKLEAGGLEIDSHEFSLNSMLEELIDLFAHQVNVKGLEIAYLLEPNVTDKLFGDSFRLRQIFINLIGNAIKFTKDGSIGIKVADATEDLLAKENLSNQNQELTKLIFEVRDTGIGISEAAQQKLFKSFSKDLTLLARTEQKTDSLLAENRKAKWQDVKVLLVEDTISNQKVILNQLKLLGYEADCVNNGEEALEQLAESEYDLILMDCQMPLLDGEHTTRILRKQAKKEGELKIIGLTAYAMTGDLAEIREAAREKCLAAGMNDFLSKPVGMKELSAMLEKWSTATIRQHSKAEKPMPNPKSPMSANQSPIDVDRLHKYTDGDAELEAELLEVFAQEAERIIQEAQEAEARGDATSLTQLIHQLKGSSAYLGVRWMPELAAKLEKQAKVNNLQEAKQILTKLEQILQQVKVFLAGDGQ